MLRTATLALAACLLSQPALALDVVVQQESAATPEAVWTAIGDFCGIAKWHPAIAKCEMSAKGADTFRALTLKGGGVVNEKQLSFDNKTMSYSYTIEDSPLPVKNYSAVLSVKPKDKGSVISWTAKFDARDDSDADAIKTITGIFEAGVTPLKATK
jgi:Polyketide cyclase / dehydrase and lipid transport